MSKLLPGENLVLKDHPHWITVVKTLPIPIVLVILVLWADFTVLLDNHGLLPIPNFRTFLALAATALALLWFIVVWIRWQSISYTLTDQRIKIESGVFGRQEEISPIDRVHDCTTNQSLVGRVLGYGRGEVEAVGWPGADVLVHPSQTEEFRDQDFDIICKW